MPLQLFGTPKEKPQYKTEFKKTPFVDLNSTSVVRILTNGYVSVQTHFINRATVKCLGEGCPVCANNKMLIMQFPDSFRDEAKYSPRRTVNLVNVIDKTLVKLCECGIENKVTPGVSTCQCGKILTGNAAPSNKVKVLSRGSTLFDDFDNINNAILDATGEPVGLTNYDLTLVVSGVGKAKKITPIAGQISEAPVVNDADLTDLDRVTIELTATELVDLQRGVSLKDIFAARRASEKSASIKDDFISKDTMDDIDNEVAKLFGN